jgi:hypothetical protein
MCSNDETFYIVTYRLTAKQRVAEHIPATTNTSVATQRAIDTTIEEDVFSMDPPRGYVSDTEPNQVSRTLKNENENGACPSDLWSG